jgi:nitrite reductase (NADH) small subunit
MRDESCLIPERATTRPDSGTIRAHGPSHPRNTVRRRAKRGAPSVRWVTSDAAQDQTGFLPVCRVEELEVERGAAALVHGQAVALFRTADDQVHAVSNHDPFEHTSGLARGIVGRRGDVQFVASPRHGHAFDLATGRCLDDAAVAVSVYDVRVTDGVVEVGHRRHA